MNVYTDPDPQPLRAGADEPAHPVGSGYYEHSPGMSMRQWYKGMALVGLLSSLGKRRVGYRRHEIANEAAGLADAMLEEDGKGAKS